MQLDKKLAIISSFIPWYVLIVCILLEALGVYIFPSWLYYGITGSIVGEYLGFFILLLWIRAEGGKL